MPGQPVVLEELGGLVATARPEDVPEGASPRTYDTDFVVGRFIQRPGTQNIYSYQGASFGPRGGGSATDIDTESSPWANPDNILANDGSFTTSTTGSISTSVSPTLAMSSATWSNAANATSSSLYASVSVPSAAFGSTNTLIAQVSGLTIPSSATILGIKITYDAYSTSSGSMNIASQLNFSGTGYDYGITNTPTGYVAGSDTDLWGTAITPALLNAGFYAYFLAFDDTGPYPQTAYINNLVLTIYYSAPVDTTDILKVSAFGFSVPSTSAITGIAVSVKGYASSATLYAQLVQNGLAVGNTESIALPTSNAFVTLGGETDVWGSTWNYTQIDASNFGVYLWAETSITETVYLDYCEIIVYGTATSVNFNGLMDANIYQGDQITLALDADGLTWEEDVTNAPNVLALASQIPVVPAGSYLKGVDANGVAYMAFSDLTEGTSQPMQYNDQWCDRITQVGPGAAPSFAASEQAGSQATISAYSYSGGILTLTTSTQAYTAGELVTFSGFTGGCVPLNGLIFSILGTGLTTTQIEIATYLVSGSGSDSGVATPQYSYPIVASPNGIKQPAAESDPGDPGHFQALLWSTGPGSTTPGNIITVYYSNQFYYANPDTVLVNAFNQGYPVYVYISGAPFGNGTWQVTGVGSSVPPGGEYPRWFFTYQVTSSNYQFFGGPDIAPGTYQITQATITLTTAVPNLAPGNQVSLSGVTGASWDGVYTVVESLNSGAFTITQTQLTAGVATYTWALVSGIAPAPGQLVTVTDTLNANGLLNVTDAVIASATGVSSGTFTVNGFPSTTDYPVSVEAGKATTAGTQFIIDPGAALAGTVNQSPILGNSGGGLLTVVGASVGSTFPIGAGTRQGVVFFITRNGAVTSPSPPSTFTVNTGANYITASNIPIGPPNVVARGIAFTEAGQDGVPGANFYTYDVPVTFTVGTAVYTASALIVPDNTTTTMKFTFSDYVLLSSDEIDVEGNNYFNLMELGNPAWIFQYAKRMLYGLCQSKIQNFLNLSFDGGYLPTYTNILPMPLGWNAPTNGNIGSYAITAFSITSHVVTFTASNSLAAGNLVAVNGLSVGTYLNGLTFTVATATSSHFTASFSHIDVGSTADSGTVAIAQSSIGLVPSLDFGNALQVLNLGASSWTDATVLFQSAYQDVYGVAILQPNTPYSVRLKGRAIGANGQTVTVQLLSFANGIFASTVYGSASFTVNLGAYQNQTATLVTGTGIPTIPAGLVLCLGISSIAPNNGVEIDRIEIFPTDHPVDTTTVWTSYAGKFESVDRDTGELGVGDENPQPATGAFQLLEQLYINKTSSRCVTQDSPNYEPWNWDVKQASDRVGACGPNASDEGEEFEISATRSGLYLFDGGKPMPIMRELQSSGVRGSVWELLNWNAGSTIWVRNDLLNRRLYVGIPMITPNFYLPNALSATPTSPNVILMCNYTGCPTGEELAASSEVHITMFGDLKALDMRRKWSIWQIPCPVAEFITRPDTFTDQLLLCNGVGSSKIYQLVNGSPSGGQNTDDGAAINWNYTTYGFTKAKQGQENPMLGALRKVWYYLSCTAEGIGQVARKLYSNSLGALPQNTYTVPLPMTLAYPQQRNQECTLEIGGQRVFLEFTPIGTGGYAEIGPVLIDGEMDKNSPHTGVSA